MNFQSWIKIAKELMDMVHQVPKDYPEMIQEYNSASFTIRYNQFRGCTTFKRSEMCKVEPVPVPKKTTPPGGSNTVVVNGSITINAPLHPHQNMISTSDNDVRLQVNMTVKDDNIIDLKFIRKTSNSGFQFLSNDLSEDGGIIEHTMLYIGDEKMIYNGTIVDMNSPYAFTHDISTESDVSIMELYNLKEYYENRTHTV